MPDIGSAPNKTFQRTDGTRTGAETWQEAKTALVKIRADAHDTHDEDIGDALTNRWMLDGGNQPTADLPMNSQKFTGVGSATARTHFASAGQVADGALVYAGTSSGDDTITASVSPAITAYAAGQTFRFLAGGTNTGAATININSVGAKSIKKGADGTDDPAAGDITEDGIYEIVYDGTNFQLLNPGASGELLAANNLSDVASAATAFTNIKQAATTDATGVVEEATDAEVRAATNGKFIDAGHLSSASALVTLTDAATVAVDWTAGINFTLTLTTDRVLGNPTNEIAGTWRTVFVISDGGPDELTFGSEYGGVPPTLDDITTTKGYLLSIYCRATGQFLVFSADGSPA